MMKKLFLAGAIFLFNLPSAWAALSGGFDSMACMCMDGITQVSQGQYCPDGTLCPYHCTGCTSGTSTNGGYQTVTTATCDGTTGNCNRSTSYRCAAGWYGSTSNGTSGCTSCASATGNSSATSAAGSTVITACYLASGTSGSDSTGTYTISGGNCFYN